jgi:hypothetical protein
VIDVWKNWSARILFHSGSPGWRSFVVAGLRVLAARCARGFDWFHPRKKEGAGNAGCTLAPAVSCAMESGGAHEHTGSAEASGIPCVMALRLMPCSSRRRIRLVTVTAGLMAHPIRLDQLHHRQLDTSNGCQNHTVLPYATTRLRQSASPGIGVVRPARLAIAHEVQPALQSLLRADAVASTTSHPAFVTTRDRPSCRNGMTGDATELGCLGIEILPVGLICRKATGKRVESKFGYRL